MTPEDARAELHKLMLAISEDPMSAQWYGDLEYVLWDRLERGSSRFGGTVLTESLLGRISALGRFAGGWFVYSDQPERESEEGARFVDLTSWQAMYAAWLRRTPSNNRPRDR